VTSFGVRVVAQGQIVEFVEGLANYAVFRASWSPYTDASGSSSPNAASRQLVQIRLDEYHSVDANTGEQTPVNTCQQRTYRH
ncbi:hypothetical protein NL455_28835, partial [Klebsiella pneumoniae]|nr:hypothetical protein [Klebsiella pneumoniae]